MSIVIIVSLLFMILLMVGGVGVCIDYIMYRDRDTHCSIGYMRDCRHCSVVDGCLVGINKRRYSKRWRDG